MAPGRGRIRAVLSLGVVGWIGGARRLCNSIVRKVAGAAERALVSGYPILVLIVHRTKDIELVSIEVAETIRTIRARGLAPRLLGRIESNSHRAAHQRLASNEVDDAANRVCSVERGGPIA